MSILTKDTTIMNTDYYANESNDARQYDGSTQVGLFWEALALILYCVLFAGMVVIFCSTWIYRYIQSRSPMELLVILWLGSAAVITATGLVLLLVDYNQ